MGAPPLLQPHLHTSCIPPLCASRTRLFLTPRSDKSQPGPSRSSRGLTPCKDSLPSPVAVHHHSRRFPLITLAYAHDPRGTNHDPQKPAFLSTPCIPQSREHPPPLIKKIAPD